MKVRLFVDDDQPGVASEVLAAAVVVAAGAGWLVFEFPLAALVVAWFLALVSGLAASLVGAVWAGDRWGWSMSVTSAVASVAGSLVLWSAASVAVVLS